MLYLIAGRSTRLVSRWASPLWWCVFRRSGAWLTRQKELAQQRRAVRLGEFLRARAPLTARPPVYARVWSDWIVQPTWETLSGWLSSDDGDELGDAAEWERQRGDWVLVGNVEVRAWCVV